MKKVGFSKYYFLAFASFFFVFFITLYAYIEFRNRVIERSKKLFDLRTNQVKDALAFRLNDYMQILKGAKGLFVVSDTVTREDWKKYVDNLEVSKNYPGILGIGYIIVIGPGEVNKINQIVKSEGFPDFNVRLQSKKEKYAPVIFLEPLERIRLRFLGFNMFSEEVRSKALVRAMENNEPAISGKIKLYQETGHDGKSGFILCLPVYKGDGDPGSVESRRKLIKGFVYNPFRTSDLMNAILKKEFSDIDIEIYDGASSFTQKDLIYNKDSIVNYFASRPGDQFDKLTHFKAGGEVWTIYFSSLPDFASTFDPPRPLLILAGGSVISLLVFFIMMFFVEEKKNKEYIIKKNKELLKINNDLDNFVYTASHDLKAPISNIEGLVSSLKEELGETIKKNDVNLILDMINQSVNRFKTTISDIVNITKINKNIYEDTSLLDVKSVVEEVIAEMSDLVNSTESVIHVYTEKSPTIIFSKINLKNIIFNLLNNSIKYRYPGRKPDIYISTRKLKDYILIEVKDNGLGISKRNQDKVFSMFRRFHDHVEGSGVGLYIVKRILDNSGGKIELESEQGVGSTFKIYFKQDL